MADTKALTECFRDTLRQLKEDRELAERTLRMQAGTVLYLKGYEAAAPEVKSESQDVSVVRDTSFHCAASFAGCGKTAVLNFANAYSPGGGVARGAMAQEECLCRSSSLYAALTLPYIIKNYYKANQKNTGDMGTDAVIYSPGVVVFKTDDPVPADMTPRFSVDVITCAAPYCDPAKAGKLREDKLREVLNGRIRNILETAAANGPDYLVLGAFGCGVFNNPPKLVAETFRALLLDRGYGRYFKKTVFAVKADDEDDPNLLAFREAFSAG